MMERLEFEPALLIVCLISVLLNFYFIRSYLKDGLLKEDLNTKWSAARVTRNRESAWTGNRHRSVHSIFANTSPSFNAARFQKTKRNTFLLMVLTEYNHTGQVVRWPFQGQVGNSDQQLEKFLF